METTLHLRWEGPLSISQALSLNDAHGDRGLYQIYGFHGVYGDYTLLYLGMALKQTFGTRLKQHELDTWYEPLGEMKVHVGRLAGPTTTSDEEWRRQLALIEKLLIFVHTPTYNSASVAGMSQADAESVKDIRVLNWEKHGLLLPEVSGARWSKASPVAQAHEIYRMGGDL